MAQKFGLARVAGAVILAALAGAALSAEQVKEDYHPNVNGSPVTLIKDNVISQMLGGRTTNLDLWAGEFVRYDNNIYNTSSDTSDVVLTTAAGAYFQTGEKGAWNAEIVGQALYNVYTDHSDYNGYEGLLHAKGSIVISPAMEIHANLGYDRTYDNVRNIKDIYDNDFYTAGAGVSLMPTPYLKIDVDYGYAGQRRDSALDYAEYDEHSINVKPSFAVTDNTSIYLRVSEILVNSKGGWYGDATMTNAVFGTAWRYRDAGRIYGEVGLTYMDFDKAGSTTIDYQDESKTRPSIKFGAEFAINADWKVGADVSYAPQVGATTTSSKDSAYVDRFMLAAHAAYSPGAGRFTLMLTPFWSDVDPSNNVAYREWGGTFGATYCFQDWINGSFGYRYTNTKYDDASSYDRHVVMAGLAITF